MPDPINEPTSSPVSPASYTSILDEHNIHEKQKHSRVKLLKELEKKEFNNGNTKNAVLVHIAREGDIGSALESSDVSVLGNELRSVGDVETLTLLLHSPGGDGTCVEKVVSLCRAQCQHFRVIIPNKAKSAATMISLGADEIIMGPSSEIGPIDAQVPVVVSGIPRYISAQSFIDAKNKLLTAYAEAKSKKQDTKAILQMIASLDLPFIEECQRMMDFGKEAVRSLLSTYMFAKQKKDKAARVDKVVQMLSSVETHKVHGRLINGITARKELGLTVKLLGKDDPMWQIVWEYYTRAEISLATQTASKMFETRHETLLARRTS